MPKSSNSGGFCNSARARALAAALCMTVFGPAFGAEPETVVVLLDQAKIMRLPQGAQTIIIGNPSIADVTVQKNGVLIVTGKSYGVTNLLALDPAGVMVVESMIRVQAPTEAIVTVLRGIQRESYSCSPQCQPTANLGDATGYFGEVSGQTSQRNALAGGGTK